MIVKRTPQKSNMHLFFAYEAENDKDTKDEIIKIRPRQNVSTDYADGLDDTQDDSSTATDENPQQEETQPAEEDNDSPTDYFSFGDDNGDTDDTADETDEAPAEGQEGEDSTDGEDAPTDYTDGDADTSEDQDTPPEPEQPEEQGEDQYKKYVLYQDFVNLYNSNKLFISKLESTVKDAIEANMVLKTVVSNLRDLNDLLFDYMTIKFMTAPYIQSLFFFKSSIAAVTLNFELLKNNESFLNQ